MFSLGLNEPSPAATELDNRNALALASLVSGAKRFLRYVITLLFLFYYGFLLFYMKSGNYEPLYILTKVKFLLCLD
jgi:hypothetical protein